MRTITTIHGSYDVLFAWSPTADGKCMIQFSDHRRIPVIAAEFDGLETIHYTDEATGTETDWTGYTKLENIITVSPGVVQVKLGVE